MIVKKQENEKAEGTNKCVIKRRLQFNNDCNDYLLNNKIILKLQQDLKVTINN